VDDVASIIDQSMVDDVGADNLCPPCLKEKSATRSLVRRCDASDAHAASTAVAVRELRQNTATCSASRVFRDDAMQGQ